MSQVKGQESASKALGTETRVIEKEIEDRLARYEAAPEAEKYDIRSKITMEAILCNESLAVSSAICCEQLELIEDEVERGRKEIERKITVHQTMIDTYRDYLNARLNMFASEQRQKVNEVLQTIQRLSGLCEDIRSSKDVSRQVLEKSLKIRSDNPVVYPLVTPFFEFRGDNSISLKMDCVRPETPVHNMDICSQATAVFNDTLPEPSCMCIMNQSVAVVSKKRSLFEIPPNGPCREIISLERSMVIFSVCYLPESNEFVIASIARLLFFSPGNTPREIRQINLKEFQPTNLALYDSQIYVTDNLEQCVYILSLTGEFVKKFDEAPNPENQGCITGISVSNDLIVVSRGRRGVLLDYYRPDGSYLLRFEINGTPLPRYLACHESTTYLGFRKEVMVIEANTERPQQKMITDLGFVKGILVKPDGQLLVSHEKPDSKIQISMFA